LKSKVPWQLELPCVFVKEQQFSGQSALVFAALELGGPKSAANDAADLLFLKLIIDAHRNENLQTCEQPSCPSPLSPLQSFKREDVPAW
jgi:hypothetical protein